MQFLSQLLNAISLVPTLLQIVNQAVVTIEQGIGSIPGVTGSQKLQAAEATVNSWLKTAITDVGQLQVLQTVVTPLITSAVAAFNAANIFTHKNTATVTPPTA